MGLPPLLLPLLLPPPAARLLLPGPGPGKTGSKAWGGAEAESGSPGREVWRVPDAALTPMRAPPKLLLLLLPLEAAEAAPLPMTPAAAQGERPRRELRTVPAV